MDRLLIKQRSLIRGLDESNVATVAKTENKDRERNQSSKLKEKIARPHPVIFLRPKV